MQNTILYAQASFWIAPDMLTSDKSVLLDRQMTICSILIFSNNHFLTRLCHYSQSYLRYCPYKS
jgi:hypothetical protein